MKKCRRWAAIPLLFLPLLFLGNGCEKEPLAGFTATPLSGPAPLTVHFTDRSILEKKPSLDQWFWDFGDGNTATEQEPSHIYRMPGIYTVSLTVTTNQGKENTAILADYITVLARIPNLVGQTQSGAQSLLNELGLSIGSVSLENHDTIPSGVIIRQIPAATAIVEPGTPVHVMVSDGPGPVSVPDVSGMSQAEAASIFQAAGLELGQVTEAYHESIPAGTVLQQSPAAGALVYAGTPVHLTLSRGMELVVVPDLGGMLQEEAIEALEAAQLRLGIVIKENHESVPANAVLGQEPEPGAQVHAGTAINLYISRGPAPYGIPMGSIEELQRIGADPDYPLDAHYYLSNDINAAGTAFWNDGAGFQPIGVSGPDEEAVPFTGGFDGQGYVITGLTINRPAETYVGLFGAIGKEGFVFNLRIVNGKIKGHDNTGSLAGYSEGQIASCHVAGSVTGLNASAGVLIGYNHGTLVDCHARGEATGYGFYTGGLAGYNRGNLLRCSASSSVKGNLFSGGLTGWNFGTLSQCHATGRVLGEWYVGGLCGENWAGSITRCYATGPVTGQNSAGGLIGYNGNAGFISECYALGAVSSNWIVGGLVGYNSYGSIIMACYSAGRVTGFRSVGGLIGENNYGVVSTSFWDVSASGTAISAAGTGLDTEQMQLSNVFITAGWDLFNVWQLLPGSYPSLRNTP